MTRYLTKADVRVIIEATLPSYVTVRDIGQLHAALLRPQTTAFGDDAYPDVWQKAAALMQSVLIGHPLSDGNKRLAWISAKLFLRLNGQKVGRPDQNAAYDLVIAVTTGDLADVPEIADRLRGLMPPVE
ncbi:type II toxin-antitoxin system death-on-curing family toxin [Nocardiopsis dassonvillei]|uniref:Death-on-curing family protein n=1 Tax=Nocardiopsis dassonvillei (strain ATCC 23218 / DSM 43111 / CIP 107115 / JCM 7437 / KCTC 9190 / NBRC 14626 / NCTC 10488 / NRRL B-5397 / IMRU 509) TaxID=446468 RepID=D7B6M9_NOCDD|nr:Fic family protein [Nocardiopsis dassonvillei]ADH69316.1 death-on-curing family protein [Nocardiopsis dassonvillei subsp. dassonvillei DSM 43111]VEI89826.1 death-on-curing family protein [Nocardiopsis dassonvillei]